MTALPPLPDRPADGHKGTFGTVCVVGGQATTPRVMIGGPAFTALAALRSGCGLAVLAMPRPILTAGLTIAPSATGLALPVDRQGVLIPSGSAEVLDDHLSGIDCLAIGPGLGAGMAQQQVVARLVSMDDRPLVIDADGLNALAALPDFQHDLRADAVLTPHPGEFRRLAEGLGIEVDGGDQNQRRDAAVELARRLGCIVVLKGNRTVVTDGQNTQVNETGNVALATAGTGDILTGIIAGLVAQYDRGDLSLLDCARLGVHIHGLAADLWAREQGSAGLLAMDLLPLIPEARNSLR